MGISLAGGVGSHGGGGYWRLTRGDPDAEGAALPDLTIDRDFATVRFDDLLCNG